MRDGFSRPPAAFRAALTRLLSSGRRARAARLSAACALVALTSATALSEGALRSSVAAAAETTRDLIAERSPGLRTRADLTKGKPAAAPDERVARALPRVRDARGSTAAPAPVAAPADSFVPPAAVAAAPGGIVPGDAAPAGGALFPVGGGVGGPVLFAPVPGPGIGGGPGGGIIIGGPAPQPTPTPPVTVNPPAAIPEPATWATMLVGFLGLGAVLRRRRHGLAFR